jgi:ankyrin repeat protein
MPIQSSALVSPCEVISNVIGGRKRQRCGTVSKPSDERLAAYCNDVVNAIRRNDIPALQQLYDDGHSFDACNMNGETLLHLACRRGDIKTIKFLVDVAGVDTNSIDSMGRTVLHDVCWRPRVDLDIMEFMITKVMPDLLVSADIRGHTCFDYCRKDNWNTWVEFLYDQSAIISKRMKIVEKFSSSVQTVG